MYCIICNFQTEYYFSKTYSIPPIDEFMDAIGIVDYYKCKKCGFVLSKTHTELPSSLWEKLNTDYHHYFENLENKKESHQPPYLEQAIMLRVLASEQLIDIKSIIDYAAGYGTLSTLLEQYLQIHLPIFDPYIQHADSVKYIHADNLGLYKTVINSAMFEHILHRSDLDQINNLVTDNGCLILHTVICETIPKDPDWFYLRPPVHTAFHTNKSMKILMEQWGYSCSAYCPQSKCWILFKQKKNDIEKIFKSINKKLQTDWFYFKDSFVDYWKGF